VKININAAKEKKATDYNTADHHDDSHTEI
jgi:hypothetical protein